MLVISLYPPTPQRRSGGGRLEGQWREWPPGLAFRVFFCLPFGPKNRSLLGTGSGGIWPPKWIQNSYEIDDNCIPKLIFLWSLFRSSILPICSNISSMFLDLQFWKKCVLHWFLHYNIDIRIFQRACAIMKLSWHVLLNFHVFLAWIFTENT